jgi:hypothetical protein
MRRALHLFVIAAILPGVILPAQAAFCFCAAIACDLGGSCCDANGSCFSAPADAATTSCCETHQDPVPSASQSTRCRGCVVVVSHKPTSTHTHKHQVDLAPPPCATASMSRLHLDDVVVAPPPRPMSHAPPDTPRNAPLLI